MQYQESDVDQKLACEAYRWTSHWPEDRAQGIAREYVNYMIEFSTYLTGFATAENQADIEADFEAFRQGYLSRLHSYLSAHSRVASAFIAGPANFPTRANEKRGNTADRRRNELIEFIQKTRWRLEVKYDPAPSRAISSDDPTAVEQLQAKIAEAERLQEVMKAANKVCRQKIDDPAKVEGLIALGLTETQARELLVPDYMGRIGFPSFALTNNSANIRRMKERIEALQAERARPAQETTIPSDCVSVQGGIDLPNPIRIVENKEENRLQIIFPGKPPVEVRDRLKAHGFRWAPSQGAWQRQLNDSARYAARQALGLE